MAVNVGATTACLQVNQALLDISRDNVPTLKITAPGLLQAITSTTNTTGFQTVETNDPRGRNTTVIVEYWQNPRAAAATTRPDICTAGTNLGKLYANVTTPSERSVSLTFDEAAFRDFCGDSNGSDIVSSPFAQQQMVGVMNQLFAGINEDAVTRAVAVAGNFYNAIAGPKTITLLKTDGSPYYGGENEIISDQQDVGNSVKPFAVGAGYLRTYTQLAQILCCNDTGIDASGVAASSFNYFFDRQVEIATVGTTQDFLVLAPGAFQLVQNNRWKGPYDDFINGAAEKYEAKTTILAPIPGGGTIELDMTVRREFCGTGNDGDSSWILTWSTRFGFWNLPSDIEAVGSPYSGVNGITHYIGTCGDITCADVES